MVLEVAIHQIFAKVNSSRAVRKFVTERTPVYRRCIVGSCIRPEWKVRVEQVLEDITLEKHGPREKSTSDV